MNLSTIDRQHLGKKVVVTDSTSNSLRTRGTGAELEVGRLSHE